MGKGLQKNGGNFLEVFFLVDEVGSRAEASEGAMPLKEVGPLLASPEFEWISYFAFNLNLREYEYDYLYH